MTQEHQDDFTQMLYDLAWKYYSPNCGMEWEDLVSEGRIGELRARRAYKKGGGAALGTLVYAYARNAMVDSLRKSNKFPDVVDVDGLVMAIPPQQESVLDGLSQEARHVVKIIFEAPMEFLELQGNRKGAGIGWANFCKVAAPKTGLSWAVLQRVFNEVREVLASPL